MATVQEPLERAEHAVAAMLREGLPITSRGIVAYLKRTEGVGCSLREATAAARAHRMAQAPELTRALALVFEVLASARKRMPADTAARMLRELRAVDWSSVLEAKRRTGAERRRRHTRGN